MRYTTQILRFQPDYDGPVVATLLHAPANVPSDKAVLYIHGYNDYFFQDHLAAEFCRQGYQFYAVDLRKHGRSLLEGQHPNFCRSLAEYYPELTESIRIIREAGNRELVIMGHSTGGLLASLYAWNGERRADIDYLILNSPFFELNTTPFKRSFLIPLVSGMSLFLPFASKRSELSRASAESINRNYHGEWTYNTKWKPVGGFPLYFSWLHGITMAQQRVQAGLNLPIPILVMSSDRSYHGAEWAPEAQSADSVLNVEDIRRIAPKLGERVTYRAIPGGLHDLTLSAPAVRGEVFRTMFTWLHEQEKESI